MKRLVFLLGLCLVFPVFSQEAVSLETPPMDDSGRPSPNVVKTALERQGVKVEVVDQVSSEQPVALPLPMAQGRLRPKLPSDASDLGLRVTNVSQGRILVVVSINGLDPRTAFAGDQRAE